MLVENPLHYGFGWFVFFVLPILAGLACTALLLWIGYLIIRTAVTNGILRANSRTGLTRDQGPAAPAGWYDFGDGRRYWNGTEWTTDPVEGRK